MYRDICLDIRPVDIREIFFFARSSETEVEVEVADVTLHSNTLNTLPNLNKTTMAERTRSCLQDVPCGRGG